MTNYTTMKTKELPWKSTVVAPADAARPTCTAWLSLDGKTGKPTTGDTDTIDWLIAIQYQTQEEELPCES